MELRQVLAELQRGQSRVADLRLSASPGVYAFFLADSTALPMISNPGAEALYLGISSNLAQRDFDTHFAAGQSGFSTVRRSLGALLREELGLRPRPRGTGASDTNYTNYRFDDAGEQLLTEWMGEKLRVGALPLAEPKRIEGELIGFACPPLNLTGWDNPDRIEIKAARKACADAARRAQPR